MFSHIDLTNILLGLYLSDGIPIELFQILKADAVKMLHPICHKFGKLRSGHSTGKGQLPFQSPKR